MAQFKSSAPFSLRKHSMPIMAIFAEAVEHAGAQSAIDLLPPGHIAVEEKERGSRYAYWVRFCAGKASRQYLGVAGGEEHLNAEARRGDLKDIQEQAKNLRKLGFEPVEHEAALVIAELANAGVFSGGGLLIGTRAFGSILNHLGYKATPFLATHDVDIARATAIKLVCPLPKGGFLDLLKQTGLRFTEVLGLERPPGPSTSYKVIGKNLKVDLLAPGRLASKPYQTIPVPELDTHATTLPFLDYLLVDSWQTIIVGRDHLIPVHCPQPARYCLHKMVVAALRTGTENPKVEKDAVQASILAAILAEEDPGALEQAAGALTAAMLKHARKTLPRVETMLQADYRGALELMQRLVAGSSRPSTSAKDRSK
jgi:hypothetical protein